MAKKYIPITIILFYSLLYALTLPSGLTWAYDSADGGDFLAAIATGGVPHPGGYPTYLFFASFFAKIPFASLAFRMNLFSSIAMLLAILFLYRLILKLTKSAYIASLSALIFGTFPLIWSQALITEVYALQTLLSILALFLFLPKDSSTTKNFAGGLTLGLALGNHLVAIFLFPLLFLKNTSSYLQDIKKRLLGLFLGLSVFLIIPIRAHNQAPVNWGNAVDWDGFWWLVSGEMYHSRLSHFSWDYLITAIRLWSQFLLDQMSIFGLFIAILYIVMLFKPSRLHFATIWMALVYSLFAILYFSPDSYVYLILPLLSFSIWISSGFGYLIEQLPAKKPFLKPLTITLSIAIVIVRVFSLLPLIDISSDRKVEEFAQTVLADVPDDAILITKGDEPTFSLWYFHYAVKQRPDIAIISEDLFGHPWYQNTLITTYPKINLPNTFSTQILRELNPQRPVCILSTNLKPEFECSSYSR